MQTLLALACGLVFGVGLAVSGMTNPAKVLAFLDLAGAWDPALLFVMAGAVGVNALGYQLARRMKRPWLAEAFAFPTRRDLDPRLLGGAALFGVGWGFVGLCPGPALANLLRGSASLYLFVAALLAGAVAFQLRESRQGPSPSSPPSAATPRQP